MGSLVRMLEVGGTGVRGGIRMAGMFGLVVAELMNFFQKLLMGLMFIWVLSSAFTVIVFGALLLSFPVYGHDQFFFCWDANSDYKFPA